MSVHPSFHVADGSTCFRQRLDAILHLQDAILHLQNVVFSKPGTLMAEESWSLTKVLGRK